MIIDYREDPDLQGLIDWIQMDWVWIFAFEILLFTLIFMVEKYFLNRFSFIHFILRVYVLLFNNIIISLA